MRFKLHTLVLALWLALSAVSLPAAAQGPLSSAAGDDLKIEAIQLKIVGPNFHNNGKPPHGLLYLPAGKMPKTVVIFAHPEYDFTMDWHCAALARAGFAAFGLAFRFAEIDQHVIMEEEVLDLAEAIRTLKQDRGFTHVILHGHSGGGSTVAFYQEQAEKQPPNRLKSTPAGDPPNLNEFALPQADGIVLSAAHWGRGYAVSRKLDPSVVDEEDPLSVDPSVDPFDPRNGYRPPPQNSQYSPEFLKRFEAGQQARMERLVQKAFTLVRERQFYAKLLAEPDFKQRSIDEQLRIQRGAIVQRYMTIYRNYANLYFMDASIDPNDRVSGGNRQPHLQNYYANWHPRTTSPEAFLSSNSTASNCFSLRTLPGVTVPVMVVLGSADSTGRLSESKMAYDAAASKDKVFVVIEGAEHFYQPAGPKAGKGDQRQQKIRVLSEWLSKRYAH